MAFVVAPLVLHRPTRQALPTPTRTHLPNWVADHPALVAGLAARSTSLAPAVREGLRFGVRHQMLTIEQGSLKSRIPSKSRTEGELADLIKVASLIGRPVGEQRRGEVPAVRGERRSGVSAFSGDEEDAQLHVAAAARVVRLAPEVETSVHRVVQEALTNVRRHAPGAVVAVRVDVDGHRLRVEAYGTGRAPRRPGRRARRLRPGRPAGTRRGGGGHADRRPHRRRRLAGDRRLPGAGRCGRITGVNEAAIRVLIA
ncbi:three component ABC system middle component, partial [Streptomyces sp. NPDC057438]|uniref:three component ABC system middle component n=1 Tax=Streptomyces sp. NPDC057438 TaxID=3346133 RepID=UPI0036C59ED4